MTCDDVAALLGVRGGGPDGRWEKLLVARRGVQISPEELRQEAAAAVAALAGHLRMLRGDTPLTLETLSRETNISVSSLSRYFTGQALPTQETVEVLGDLCGGEIAQLQTLWEAAAAARGRLRAATHAVTGEIPDVAAVRADTEDLPALAGQLWRPFHLPNPFRRRPVRYSALTVTVIGLMALTGITVHTLTLKNEPTGGDAPYRAAPAAAGPTPETHTTGGPSASSSSPTPSVAAVPTPPPGTKPGRTFQPVPPKPSPASPTPAPSASRAPAPSASRAPVDLTPLPPVEPKCEFSNSTRSTHLGVETFLIARDGTLKRGQVCQLGKAQLTMQQDGDLVVRIVGKAGPQWAASWTQPNVKNLGASATIEHDANLVLLDAGGSRLWTSRTSEAAGGNLAVQADGNVVLYADDWHVLWATDTDQKA